MRREGAHPGGRKGETWPPRGGAYQWRLGRSRFVRRVALLFALFLLLSGVGLVTLVSLAFGRIAAADVGAWTRVIAAAALIAVVVVPFTFVAAMRRVGLPFGDVVGAAHRVADGDYSARVAERGPPFLRAIARAFNVMTTRLEAQDRQRRDLMADIAHQLRNWPFDGGQGRLEGLLDGGTPATIGTSAKCCRNAASRAAGRGLADAGGRRKWSVAASEGADRPCVAATRIGRAGSRGTHESAPSTPPSSGLVHVGVPGQDLP